MARTTLPLQAYLGATHFAPLIAARHLRKRVARGKEDPVRWTEKLGKATRTRPAGQVIWLHAVGLGEVLSLRGLIAAMAPLTDAHFLVTSSTVAGAQVLARNMPPRTTHQFLPLDAPPYRRAFLDHWRPDLCLWAEQDLWPGFVEDLARRTIPQAMIAARMNDESLRKKQRLGATFRHLYSRMVLITAYDHTSAQNVETLLKSPVRISGSLKPAAPALGYDPAELAHLQSVLEDKFVWITAPSHHADEEFAIAAHKRLLEQRSDALLIVAPRFPDRTVKTDLNSALRSSGQDPTDATAVYVADTFGDLGLLYRLASATLVGGSNDATQGHSPWEAANLETAIFHGPHIGNFTDDFAALHAVGAAVGVSEPADLANALTQDLASMTAAASRMIAEHRTQTARLAADLVALI